MEYSFDWPSSFRKMSEYFGNVHVYSSGAGLQTNPWTKMFS